MKKNEIYDIKIVDIGNNGEGIGKISDFVVFIPYTLIGETVRTLILKVNKNFAFGKALDIIEKSEYRVEPVCPYFYKCGGCNLQHINYAMQLEYKTKIVKTTLEKQLNINLPMKNCYPSPISYGYRNKMQLPINEKGIGMYRENSHDLIPISNCVLCDDWIKSIIEIIKIYIQKSNISLYNEETNTGYLKHLLVRKIEDTFSITLVLNNDNIPSQKILISLLNERFKNTYSLFCCVNKIKSNTILTNDIKCVYGTPTQKATDFNIEYFISPNSFMQINHEIQNVIYKSILNSINATDTIIDAYSGAGLLSAILSEKANEVYGIEIVESATKNADALMVHNNINNVKNINGDCAEILPNLISDLNHHNKHISLVLDPPRKGCDKKVIDAILQSLPNEIYYISCNPSTLARDLKLLTKSYTINSIQPFDMFPQTKHIETLVKLSCVDSKDNSLQSNKLN